MGAKNWMLVYADSNAREALAAHPALDRAGTQRLVKKLFPREDLKLLGDGALSYTCPPEDEIHIGQFAGVSVVAAREFGIDHPSQLPEHFLKNAAGNKVYLHAMHSVVDWFAYAIWKDGKLLRSLSLSPDSGILEDIGDRQPFEEPYWSGQYPAVEGEDTYPLPFHPLELGEATMAELFGYQFEGSIDSWLLDPESVPLLTFKRSASSRWKFWR